MMGIKFLKHRPQKYRRQCQRKNRCVEKVISVGKVGLLRANRLGQQFRHPSLGLSQIESHGGLINTRQINIAFSAYPRYNMPSQSGG
jgi:hypothetical protein